MVSPSEIHRRNSEVIPQFATFYGESLLPPSENVMNQMNTDTFETQYPVRKKLWEEISNPYHIYSPQERQEFRFKAQWLKIANNMKQYAIDHYASEGIVGIRLKEKQMAIFDDISSAIENGDREMHVEAPPGFGKTVLFNQVVSAADVPTIIVVPSQALVEQTYKRFQQYTPDISVGRVYGKEKEYGRKVTITTYDSLVGDEEKLINPDGIGLIILDEMHKGISKKRIEKIQLLEAFKNAIMLGFSATPIEITDKRVTHTRVAKMTQNKIHRVSDEEAVEEGYTSPFTVIYNEVDVDLSNVKVNIDNDYNDKELDEKINTLSQNKAAIEFFIAMRDKIKKRYRDAGLPEPKMVSTMVFVKSITHAQDLAKEFQAAGVEAAAVWGTQKRKKRHKIMEQFEAQENIEVIVNNKYLAEGIDIPHVKLIENVAPTSSPSYHKQRTGRGTRIDPNDPFKHLYIGEFIYRNSNARTQQVTYPQLIGNSTMVRTNVDPTSSISGGGGVTIDLSDISIEGIKIINNPEEVMTITRHMEENTNRILPPPDGWMMMGNFGYKNTLAGELNRSNQWVIRYLPEAINEIEKNQDRDGIPKEDRKPNLGIFVRARIETTFYSPLVLNILKAINERQKKIPNKPIDWMVLGHQDYEGTMVHELKKDRKWIAEHIPEVLLEIVNERLEEGIPHEQQEPVSGIFLLSNQTTSICYAPIVIEKLRRLKERGRELSHPAGWKLIGQLGAPGDNICNILSRSPHWISKRLPKVLDEIERERIEMDKPEEEREPVAAKHMSITGETTYYAPIVFNKLKALVDKEGTPPEGWMTVINIATLVGRDRSWIEKRVPQIIQTINQENEGSQEKRLFGDYRAKSKVATFYSTEIIERLEQMAKESKKK